MKRSSRPLPCQGSGAWSRRLFRAARRRQWDHGLAIGEDRVGGGLQLRAAHAERRVGSHDAEQLAAGEGGGAGGDAPLAEELRRGADVQPAGLEGAALTVHDGAHALPVEPEPGRTPAPLDEQVFSRRDLLLALPGVQRGDLAAPV